METGKRIPEVCRNWKLRPDVLASGGFSGSVPCALTKLPPAMFYRSVLTLMLGALPLGVSHGAEEIPPAGKTYEIEDGGVLRTFTVSGKSLGVKGAADGLHIVEAPAAGKNLREQFRLARAQDPTLREVNLALVEAGAKSHQGKPAPLRALTCMVLVELPLQVDAAALALQMGAASVESPTYAPGRHIFHCADQGGALNLMERLRARPEVLSAHALLTRPLVKKYAPNDTYFTYNASRPGYCWHLKNTGNWGGTANIDLNVKTTTCWDLYRGSGVTLGVVDDGVEITHPDLVLNYSAAASHDFFDNDSDPSPGVGDDHGTSVAGLAVARGNNGAGVCGVAPEATLAGLRIGLSGGLDDLQISNAFAHQNNVISIKTNSWGPDDSGYTLEGPGALTTAALQDAITNGRGGKGTIFLFAGGNGADVGDDSNYDGFANSIYTIAITAVSDKGTPAYYAEPGANLVAAAPGNNDDDQGLTTTDRSGANGYNDGSSTSNYSNTAYTNDFGGTSGATPQAAGVVALMLQAKPTLGWRDVQEILMASAKTNNAADTDWTTNAGGFHFNHLYGAGLIDATVAVTKAATWTNLAAQTSVTLTNVNLALAIPDGPSSAGVTTPFNFAAQSALRVEHVTVQVNATHSRRGDLDITLTSPSGMKSRLAERHDDDTANLAWTFMSVRHWGENSSGTWKVSVVDRNYENVGTLNSVTLKIYGTSASVPSGVPVVASVLTSSAIVGAPYTYQITASNAPISFNATGLPAGLSVNASTGVISGTPSAAAATNIVLTATNAAGTSATKTLVLTTSAQSTLANAVDYPATTWVTGGDVLWTRNTSSPATTTNDGIDSAKPNALAAGQISYLKAFVKGPALLTYWRRVATSVDIDFLDFYVDADLIDSESGSLSWIQKTKYLSAGRHTLRWECYRDSVVSSTAYVDQVTLSDPATIAPLIISPPKDRNAPVGGKTCFRVAAVGQPPLTYQWRRDGLNVPSSNAPVLLVEPVPARDVAYTCTVSNSLNAAGVTSAGGTLTITPAVTATSLATALDNSQLSWGTNATYPWALQSAYTNDLVDALRSAVIGDSGATTFETCLTGPVTVKFFWKASCELNADYLDLTMDDQGLNYLTGEQDWQAYSLPVPAGHHIVGWTYDKDSSAANGLDAGFVDQVSVTPTGYAGWEALQFTPTQRATANLTGPTNDADGDGIRNLMEYALGLNPNVRDAKLLPGVVKVGGNLEFTFPKNTLLGDITYVPETSANLASGWGSIAATDVSGSGDVRMMKVSLPLNAGRGFVRLRVTQP